MVTLISLVNGIICLIIGTVCTAMIMAGVDTLRHKDKEIGPVIAIGMIFFGVIGDFAVLYWIFVEGGPINF